MTAHTRVVGKLPQFAAPYGSSFEANGRGPRHTVAQLPTDSAERKGLPIATGVLDYFPDAFADIARLSKVGNDKHNPGQPLHWNRPLSSDHADTLMRHFIERGTIDADGVRHSTKVAWRALAILQLELEGAATARADFSDFKERLGISSIADEERIVTMQAHDDLHNDHDLHPGLAIVPLNEGAGYPPRQPQKWEDFGGNGEGAL